MSESIKSPPNNINDVNIHSYIKDYMTVGIYAAIGEWNVGDVTNMDSLFLDYPLFNEDISDWDVSNVTDMGLMFAGCSKFNQPLDRWDVSNVQNMAGMFDRCSKFNKPLDRWDVSNVQNMALMFNDCSIFNQPLNNWRVGKVKNMAGMFAGCKNFDQDLSTWMVRRITHMEDMFFGCGITEDHKASKKNRFEMNIDNTNIHVYINQYMKKVGNLAPIGQWDVGDVTNMDSLFLNYPLFNEDISDWDVSNVQNMAGMFAGCSKFNQPLDRWDVSNVQNMAGMFAGCSIFNKPLNNWRVGKVQNMAGMFAGCKKFNQDLSTWMVRQSTDMKDMFSGCGITEDHKASKNRFEMVNKIYANNKTALFFACEQSLFEDALRIFMLMLNLDPTKPNKISIQDIYGNTALEIVSNKGGDKNKLLDLLKEEFKNTYLDNNEYKKCVICFDLLDGINGPPATATADNEVISVCENSHIFHRQCIINACNAAPNKTCPVCRQPLIPECIYLNTKKGLPMSLISPLSPSRRSHHRSPPTRKTNGGRRRRTVWRRKTFKKKSRKGKRTMSRKKM